MHPHHYTCLLVLFGVVAVLTKKENADCKYDLFVETGYWPSGGTDNWVDFKFQIVNRTSTGFSEKFSYPDNGWLTYEPTDDDNYYEPGKVERWSWNCSKLASFAITGIHVRLRKIKKQDDGGWDWTMSRLWMQEKTGQKRTIEFAYIYQDFCVGDSHFFPVLNCVVDEWGQWSACATDCTDAKRHRTRVVSYKNHHCLLTFEIIIAYLHLILSSILFAT